MINTVLWWYSNMNLEVDMGKSIFKLLHMELHQFSASDPDRMRKLMKQEDRESIEPKASNTKD